MADTGTLEIPVRQELRRPFMAATSNSAISQSVTVNLTGSHRAAVTHQLSRLEQIVEYLKVLYR